MKWTNDNNNGTHSNRTLLNVMNSWNEHLTSLVDSSIGQFLCLSVYLLLLSLRCNHRRSSPMPPLPSLSSTLSNQDRIRAQNNLLIYLNCHLLGQRTSIRLLIFCHFISFSNGLRKFPKLILSFLLHVRLTVIVLFSFHIFFYFFFILNDCYLLLLIDFPFPKLIFDFTHENYISFALERLLLCINAFNLVDFFPLGNIYKTYCSEVDFLF